MGLIFYLFNLCIRVTALRYILSRNILMVVMQLSLKSQQVDLISKDHINNGENFDRCLLFLFFLDTKKVVVVLYVKFFTIIATSPLSPASPFSLLPCHQ